MLKQGLEIKQQQKLSPLQIQTIRLIETPIVELAQAVRNELDNNPVLDDDSPSERKEDDEQPKDVSIDEIKDDGEIPSYKLRVNNWGKDERPEYNTFSVKESFTQSLTDQLGFRQLTPHEYEVGKFLIGSLDEDGYLRRDFASLADDMAFRFNIETDEEEIGKILRIIQDFEPVGVGARDLRECLLLQLRGCEHTEEVSNAETIVRDYFPDFASKHFQKIMSRMGIDKEQLRAAVTRISKLNPNPGGQVDDSYSDQAQQVVPDFVLDLGPDGSLNLSMPRFPLPEVKVKKKYSDILDAAKTTNDPKVKEAAVFVKQRVDSAKWFVEALKQRHNTLQSTMQTIIDFQHDYFIDGDESKLKPMVLKDIAALTGFDISTISRVVSSKYIETHFGIFPLKYFFSEGLENQDGEEVSTRGLKKALQELVDGEDKSKPLTDDQLVTEMEAKGFKVARRTIAKYRDQLGIAKARLRKEL
jgi:RNA polymerase sigma-54 factor